MSSSVSSAGSTVSNPGGGAFQISGIVSGLDTSNIISQTIAAESGPLNNLKAQQTTIGNEVTAFTALSADMTSLGTATQQLSQASTFAQVAASSSNQQTLTATTTTGAVPGTYQITVNQLAQPEQLLSQGYSDPSAAVLGTGSISIQVGSAIFGPLTVDASNNSLQGLANAINSKGMGVQAAVVNDGTSNHLMLTGNATGASQTITMTSNLTGGTAPTFTTLQTAQNAIVEVGNSSTPLQINSASNQISTLIPGVTLNLNQASPGNPVTVAVTSDSSGISASISQFLSAFNQVSSTLQTDLAVDPSSTNQAGVLQGNSTAESIQNQLASLTIGSTGSSGLQSLAQIGITMDASGQLSISNQAALNTALSSNLTQVQNLFSNSTNGIMTQLNKFITATTQATTGTLAEQNTSLQSTSTDLSTSIAQQQTYLNQQQAQMQQQYADMEVALGDLQQQSAALASLGVSTSSTALGSVVGSQSGSSGSTSGSSSSSSVA